MNVRTQNATHDFVDLGYLEASIGAACNNYTRACRVNEGLNCPCSAVLAAWLAMFGVSALVTVRNVWSRFLR